MSTTTGTSGMDVCAYCHNQSIGLCAKSACFSCHQNNMCHGGHNE